MSVLDPNDEEGAKVLEFKISQVKQLRKRSDSSNPCNKDIVNYDKYYQEELIKELGCKPPYLSESLTNVAEYEICTKAIDLQEAYLKIAYPQTSLEQRQFPCYEMNLLSIDSINNAPYPEPKDVSMAFIYTEKTYEEIKYSRMMDIDGWISNVGGFIGIFLGYSLLQIPEFLVYVLRGFHSKENNAMKGRNEKNIYYKVLRQNYQRYKSNYYIRTSHQ